MRCFGASLIRFRALRGHLDDAMLTLAAAAAAADSIAALPLPPSTPSPTWNQRRGVFNICAVALVDEIGSRQQQNHQLAGASSSSAALVLSLIRLESLCSASGMILTGGHLEGKLRHSEYVCMFWNRVLRTWVTSSTISLCIY